MSVAVLAVDVGNSKTDVALVDAGGAVRGAVRGPGASHHALGVATAMELLEALIAAACDDAGLDPSERPLAEVGAWCLAGLGLLSGDWGGGRDIGIATVGAAMRGEDGRGPRTALERLVPGHFGLDSVLAVVEAVHLGRIDDDRVVELAPLVFTAAEAGDRVAARIVGRQADEVVTMARTAIRRLGLGHRDVDVVLGGGVLQRDDPAFQARISAGIRALAPAARLRRATAPPVVGAALLGLDLLGAPPGAADRLRARLTSERPRTLRRAAASSLSRQ